MNSCDLFIGVPRLKSIYHNFFFLISGCSAIAYTFSSYLSIVLASLLLLILTLYTRTPRAFWNEYVNKWHITFAYVILVICGHFFNKGLLLLFSSIPEIIECSPKLLRAFLSLAAPLPGLYFFSIILAYLDKIMGEIVAGQETSTHQASFKIKIALRAYILLSFILLASTAFTYNLWLDPSYSLIMMRLSASDLMDLVRVDVHPPLYYFILKFALDAFSLITSELFYQIVFAKIVSIVPYMLAAALLWKKLKESKTPYAQELAVIALFAIPMTLQHGVEIRMYSWAAFFLIGTFLYAREIIVENYSTKAWILFSLFSLFSAYTHTFALLSTALIWFFLFIWIIRQNRLLLKPWLIFGVIVSVAFSPWLFVLLNQTSNTAGNFWIPKPSVISCINTACQFTSEFLAIILIASIYFIKAKIHNKLPFWGDSMGLLIPASLLAITFIISVLYFPILVPRYIFPATFCMWGSVIFMWRNIKHRISGFIMLLFTITSVVGLYHHLKTEWGQAQQSANMVQLLNHIEDDAIIYIDDSNDHNTVELRYLTDNPIYISAKKPTSRFGSKLWGTSQPTFTYTEDSADDFVRRSSKASSTLYYFASKPLPQGISEYANCTYFGKAKFKDSFQIYRLTSEY